MPCLLTQGFTLDCKDQTAGIKSIYLVEFNSSDTVTKSSGEISAHTLTGGRTYFKYELEKETATSVWRTIPSTENGSTFYEADLTVRLHKLSTAKRNELKLLSQARIRCIVLDTEGNYWLYGADYGIQLQQSEVQFGQAFGDFKGSVLNFLHKETDLPAKVQSSVISSLSLS
jgi:hypothetical protein